MEDYREEMKQQKKGLSCNGCVCSLLKYFSGKPGTVVLPYISEPVRQDFAVSLIVVHFFPNAQPPRLKQMSTNTIALKSARTILPKVLASKLDTLGFVRDLGSFKSAMSITIPMADNEAIVLIGAHFPFDKEKPYDDTFRIQTLQRLASGIGDNQIAFVVGDLNFRIDSQTNKDNLLKYLKNTINFQNASIPESNPSSYPFTPTCKMAIPRNVTTCSKAQSNSSCYDKQREPSYCDRVLCLNKMQSKYMVKTISSEAILIPPIDQSDHNGVYVQVEIIDISTNGQIVVTKSQPQANSKKGGTPNKVLFKGYWYKIRIDSKKQKYIQTKRYGIVYMKNIKQLFKNL